MDSEREERMRRIFTLANIVSFSRALMAIPIVILLNRWDGHLVNFPLWAVFWIALAVFSDFLDGWFARSYHEVSWFGKILDPIADKIVILAAIFFAAPIRDRIPLWFVIFVVVRELLIALPGLWVTKDSRRQLQANRTGKISVLVLSLTLLLLIFKLDPCSYYMLLLSVAMGAVSLAFYLYEFYRFYREDIKPTT